MSIFFFLAMAGIWALTVLPGRFGWIRKLIEERLRKRAPAARHPSPGHQEHVSSESEGEDEDEDEDERWRISDGGVVGELRSVYGYPAMGGV